MPLHEADIITFSEVKMLLAACFCLLLVANLNSAFQYSDSTHRGAEIRLTKKGLKYAADIGIAKLKGELNNKRLNAIDGKSGSVSWDATNVVINSVGIGGYSVVPVTNMGLRLSISGVSVSANGRVGYEFKKGWFKVSDHTNVRASAKGVSVSLDIKIGASGGKPTLQAGTCNANVADVDLHFSGGLSWVYNLISKLFESKLKNPIKDAICKGAVKVINNDGNRFLVKFPVRENIKDYALIDYSFEKPEFTNEFMDLLLRGEFLNAKNPKRSPIEPPAFATTNDASKMIYIWLSDYTVNSAGRVIYDIGKLEERITPEDKNIPAIVKPFLSTLTIKDILPELYQAYPDHPIQLAIRAYKPPTISLVDGKASLNLYAQIGIEVVEYTKRVTPIFYMSLDIKATGSAEIVSIFNLVKVRGKITDFSFVGEVGGSIIGDISVPFKNKSIQDLVRALVIDKANPMLHNGFPIPHIKDLKLVNPSLTIVKNALRIDTDVVYKG